MEKGFTRVRPLAGGFDAWVAAGFELEDDSVLALRPAGELAAPNAIEP
jgi:3-mercaptopyruvate sulfurtransferase SseA